MQTTRSCFSCIELLEYFFQNAFYGGPPTPRACVHTHSFLLCKFIIGVLEKLLFFMSLLYPAALLTVFMRPEVSGESFVVVVVLKLYL